MLDFDPADDLAITDGTEAVTLLRRGSTPGGPGEIISHALRRAITAAEATINTSSDVHKNVPSDGQHTAASVVWHLPVAELPIAPQLGDVLLDGGGQRWTILEVKQATLGAAGVARARTWPSLSDWTTRFPCSRPSARPAMPAPARPSGEPACGRESNRSKPRSPTLPARPPPPPAIAFSWKRIWSGPYLLHPRAGRNPLYDYPQRRCRTDRRVASDRGATDRSDGGGRAVGSSTWHCPREVPRPTAYGKGATAACASCSPGPDVLTPENDRWTTRDGEAMPLGCGERPYLRRCCFLPPRWGVSVKAGLLE